MMFPIDYNGDVLNHNARVGVDGGIVESTDFLADFSEQTKRVNMPLLLDIYPNAAAAYSLRKLRTAYTGSAIRVRRSSDNTETDIGFNNAGDLDTSALATFVGNGNGFVSTWYDQSGSGNNFIQTGTTNQPLIVNTGSLLLDKSKPIISFDGVNQFLVGGVNTSQQGTIFAIFNPLNDGAFRISQADPNSLVSSFSVDTLYTNPSTTNVRFLELLSPNNIVVGNTNINNSKILSVYNSNNVAWSAWVNSNSQSFTVTSGVNTGGWFGDYPYPMYLQRLNRSTPFNNKANVQEIIIYNSNQSPNRIGIETNINSYYRIYQQEALLLDYYPDAAAAYSLRKLRSGYTGAAIQVRRSSDNAVQNIGFDSNGGLDTTALTTFVGTGNTGFVTTWYDQSGNNRNATQTTQANQPIVFSGGTTITENNKPVIYANNRTKRMNIPSFTLVGDYSIVIASTLKSFGRNMWMGTLGTSGYVRALDAQADGFSIRHNGEVGGANFSGVQSLRPELHVFQRFGTNISYSRNSVNNITTELSPQGTNFTISVLFDGYNDGIGYLMDANAFEFIIYNSNQSTNRPLIEANINSYYNIYVSENDAQSFIDAAAITNSTQRQAINKLVYDLKAYGLWYKMKAIYPFVGGTASSHKFNLKNPRDVDGAFRLVFNGGWTHSATGAKPNGTTGWANTFYNAQNNFNTASANLSYYSRTSIMRGNVDSALIGASNGTNVVLIRNDYFNFSQAIMTNGVFAYRSDFTPSSVGSGFWLGNRLNNTPSSLRLWRNGVIVGTAPTLTDCVFPNLNLYLGGLNVNNSASSYSDSECAFATIGDGLTDTEAANLYTAVQTFQTTLGRQV